MPDCATEASPPYNPDAIFHPNGPLDPHCVVEAVAAIKRALPITPGEPRDAVSRRVHAALRGLSALHARDEIELMLGVQALCAYHAATACWRLGMNLTLPHGDGTRHIATAASAARTFDSMLRALERRQAKPLAVPVGRPDSQDWQATDPAWQQLCTIEAGDFLRPAARQLDPSKGSDDEILDATYFDTEDDLDLSTVEGILPGGGIIVPEEPTPAQAAYIERRLRLIYQREREENRRNGIMKPTRFRPLHDGDLVP